jgi:hypothetical protein
MKNIEKNEPILSEDFIRQKEAIPQNVQLRWLWIGVLSSLLSAIVFWNIPPINRFYSFASLLISSLMILLTVIYRKWIGVARNDPIVRKKDIKIVAAFNLFSLFCAGHISGYVVIALIKLFIKG